MALCAALEAFATAQYAVSQQGCLAGSGKTIIRYSLKPRGIARNATFLTTVHQPHFKVKAILNNGHEELPLSSAWDLSTRYKAFSEDDDEDGNPISLYSSFG